MTLTRSFPRAIVLGMYRATAYPAGASDRRGWHLFILPYIEQANIANEYANAPDNAAPWNALACTRTVPTFHCPSEPVVTFTDVATGSAKSPVERSSYAVCATSDVYVNSGSATVSTDTGTALNGIMYPKSGTRIADITDGTSNTVMVSEVKFQPNTATSTAGGATFDARGCIWNPIHGGAFFSTKYPPNSTVADALDYCTNTTTLPCTLTSNGLDTFNSARSYHTGGVNAALADGSVRFVQSSVVQGTWQAAGGRADGLVLGSDW